MLRRKIKRLFFKKRKIEDIDPDEIFLDSSNLPEFDVYQMEGQLNKPISKKSLSALGVFFFLVILIFSFQLWVLQVKEGEAYLAVSENNRLRQIPIFANRGVIFDRNREKLAFNVFGAENKDFALRGYKDDPGLSHLLGYIKYPAKDSSGFYYREEFEGVIGAEQAFDGVLGGENGVKLIETDAYDRTQSESVTQPPQDGRDMVLSIDSRIQSKLFSLIEETAEDVGFEGGSGIIIDVHTGEIITIVSFPEFDSNILTNRTDVDAIQAFLSNDRNPFLNRAVSGLYTPGSIIKPFIALAALEEGVISPNKQILSTSSISVPNPYDPESFTVFRDWRAHGLVDMRRALAVSSNIYFYIIGGGFEGQKGLGITNIERYLKMFGFGEETKVDLLSEGRGMVPNPTWKEENFDGDPWRLGDTFNTAIGQYGLLATPIQAVRATAALANGGVLVNPIFSSEHFNKRNIEKILVQEENLKIIKEGMRQAVTEGTASGLNKPFVQVAAKTGTAELGAARREVHSWVIGFFPYEDPQYAFVVLMERGPSDNLIGGTFVMSRLLDWMNTNTPEYLE